jgi:glycosyltransferase involved in cell wall biosynthesis
MKIALDLRRINNPGIGRYMRGLAESLMATAPEHEYLLVLPADTVDALNLSSARVEKIAPPLKYYSIREQLELPRILRRHNVDLLHSPHFNIPLFSPCPVVATIHDVIYLACKDDLPSRPGRLYYRAMMRAAVRRASRIITDSEFSRGEIQRYLHSEQVDVIYPGVDPRFRPVKECDRLIEVRTKYGIRGDYILYAGIYRGRKNHAGLLRAFRKLIDLGAESALVLAGPLGKGEGELRRLARELEVEDRVIFTGFVDDTDLLGLYSGARVYACPSLYEGFGFTVLEAMACGAPVVCSAESSLPEVCGSAALHADARDAHAFGHALHQAFIDEGLRAHLVQKGQKNVARFSWRNTVLHTLRTYQEAVSGPRPATA